MVDKLSLSCLNMKRLHGIYIFAGNNAVNAMKNQSIQASLMNISGCLTNGVRQVETLTTLVVDPAFNDSGV
jgi:hypothetical protein